MNIFVTGIVVVGVAYMLLGRSGQPQPTQILGGSTSYMSPDAVPITSVAYLNGDKVYLAWDGTYTRMVTARGVSKYVHGDGQATFSSAMWDTYLRAAGQFTVV
jgi:hypothetical protein